MAQKILYINPIKKSKRSLTKKGTKTVAKRKKTRIKKRRNTIAKASPIARANPIKRRKRRVHKRKNPIFTRRRVSSAPRNENIVDKMLMPAATAAGGAIALDVLWANLPLPTAVKSGAAQPLFKALGAVALVKIAKNVTTAKNAERLGLGALTVVMYDVARSTLKKAAPRLKLSEYVGEYEMGEYVGSGGGLDFDAPLDFYTTAGEGVNTVPSFPLPAPVPAMAGGAPRVGEYVGEIDAIDDYYSDDEYFYGE